MFLYLGLYVPIILGLLQAIFVIITTIYTYIKKVQKQKEKTALKIGLFSELLSTVLVLVGNYIIYISIVPLLPINWYALGIYYILLGLGRKEVSYAIFYITSYLYIKINTKS